MGKKYPFTHLWMAPGFTGAKVSWGVLILFPPPPLLLCSPLSELLSLDEKLKEEEVDLRDDGVGLPDPRFVELHSTIPFLVQKRI